jgi:DMSO/TMAO reductase YedYZ molybdopterin-dependent catalytic subunit
MGEFVMAAPENRPAPLRSLLAERTSIADHYRRNHAPYPKLDPYEWRLEITGAVARPLSLSLADLQGRPAATHTVLLECAGHRRTEFQPPISGVQWQVGALSQAQWAGVPLASVLEDAGVAADAVEVVLTGADHGPFGSLEGEHAFERSLPMAKAMHADTLLALTMNSEPLPIEHGAPLRAVVPGWYAMDSVKWLTRVEVVRTPFRGPYQEQDYRFIRDGETGIGTRLDQVPIHSLFVNLTDGDAVSADASLVLQGIAWGGGGVSAVEVSVDGGPWQAATLTAAPGPYQRATWRATVELPRGVRDLAVRARAVDGSTQPAAPVWNKRGYANHAVQHIRVTAG